MAQGYAMIGLHHPKTAENIGGALRAAGCFGAAMVVMAGSRFHKASTDVYRHWRNMPVLCVAELRSVIPYGCVPVAVELAPNACSLHQYTHPERAFYIFGPESSSLGRQVLSWCRDVVYIPMELGCLNLAATVNVVLYDRSAKLGRYRNEENSAPEAPQGQKTGSLDCSFPLSMPEHCP